MVGCPRTRVRELQLRVYPLAAKPAGVEVPNLFAVLEVAVVACSAHMVTALSVHVVCVPVR